MNLDDVPPISATITVDMINDYGGGVIENCRGQRRERARVRCALCVKRRQDRSSTKNLVYQPTGDHTVGRSPLRATRLRYTCFRTPSKVHLLFSLTEHLGR